MAEDFNWFDAFDIMDQGGFTGSGEFFDPAMLFGDFSNFDFSGVGEGASDFMGSGFTAANLDLNNIQVVDQLTGQTISLAEAMRIDPAAAQEFLQTSGMGQLMGAQGQDFEIPFQAAPNVDPSAGQSGGLLNRMLGGLGNMNPATLAGLGLTAVTGGVGLAGIIQKAMSGDPQSVTQVQRAVAEAGPEERQAITEAIKAVSGATNFAFGSPMNLQSQLGGRVPAEEAAFGAGLERLGGRAQSQDALQATLGPHFGAGLSQILGGQQSILGALGPIASDLAKGKLNITPELESTIEEAFSPRLGDLATQLIENARQRGFAGGAELLLQAPSSSLGQTALRDIQGQMAQAKIEAALNFPRTAGDLAGAFSTPSALRLQGASNLANLDQNVIAALGGFGQQGMGNRLDFLRAATAPASAATGLAGSQAGTRVGSAGQTSTTMQPSSLLDAFAPLSGLLGGIGGALSGIGSFSAPRIDLSGILSGRG